MGAPRPDPAPSVNLTSASLSSSFNDSACTRSSAPSASMRGKNRRATIAATWYQILIAAPSESASRGAQAFRLRSSAVIVLARTD